MAINDKDKKLLDALPENEWSLGDDNTYYKYDIFYMVLDPTQKRPSWMICRSIDECDDPFAMGDSDTAWGAYQDMVIAARISLNKGFLRLGDEHLHLIEAVN